MYRISFYQWYLQGFLYTELNILTEAIPLLPKQFLVRPVATTEATVKDASKPHYDNLRTAPLL